jgi:hypothetical protein
MFFMFILHETAKRRNFIIIIDNGLFLKKPENKKLSPPNLFYQISETRVLKQYFVIPLQIRAFLTKSASSSTGFRRYSIAVTGKPVVALQPQKCTGASVRGSKTMFGKPCFPRSQQPGSL